MKGKKFAAVITAAILSLTSLSGCSEESSKQNNPNIVVSASYVNDAEADNLKQQINEVLPDMGIEVTAISVGDPNKDPASAMAGIMKLTTMFAGKEADILIADHDTAQRNAGNEIFYSLTDLFTEEELEPFQDKLISFETTDDEGKPTGEKFENCGIDISDRAELAGMCVGADSVGIYVISNSTNLDTAKEIFRQLVFQ
jgi:ABC-type glycerol-3-phosphate transport system substrate-binding protein